MTRGPRLDLSKLALLRARVLKSRSAEFRFPETPRLFPRPPDEPQIS
jgi:hypothetical protein